MKKIPLTKGQEAIVDDADYPRLSGRSWCLTNGYPSRRKTVSTNRSKIEYLHREIMQPPEGLVVDHINGDKLDNRRSNLRICTQAQNMVNWDNRRGSSAYRGVSWDGVRNCWKAQIQVNGKNSFIGRYKTESAAASAYNEKAKELFGEFARLNEVKE